MAEEIAHRADTRLRRVGAESFPAANALWPTNAALLLGFSGPSRRIRRQFALV